MAESKNVLLVTNSTSEGEILLIKEACAQAQTQELEIKLALVHVIPNLPTCYFNIPSMVLLAENYYEEATRALTSIGQLLNVAKKDQWLITGRLKTEVLRLANKLNTHFILASSTSIQDLHQSFLSLKKERSTTPIRSISSLVTI
ncbi:MAG: hypothetical protein ACD_45C00488G0004 [uncultured bacterium]|nr:MAG: hypothetical protein ACD_45C00488G0004 [uncultured bacterium]